LGDSAAPFLDAPSLHNMTNLRKYNLVYDSPSRCWQDGIAIGNGDLNALVWEDEGFYPRWELNASRLWDLREPVYKRHPLSHIKEIAAGKYNTLEEMSKEKLLSDVPMCQMSTPKYGGYLRLCMGLTPQHAPGHRITKELHLTEGILETKLDKHLSHPRIRSYVCAQENTLVISLRNISLLTAFRNRIEVGRDPELFQEDATFSAQGNIIAMQQKLPTLSYAIAAKIIPLGQGEYRELFEKMTHPKNWHWANPTTEVAGQTTPTCAFANIAGNFDVLLTIVTSDEAEDPLAKAIANLEESAAKRESLLKEHCEKWAKFWEANAVDLHDKFLNQMWYLSNYHLRCGMGGPVPFGLCGPWIGRTPNNDHVLPWNGFYTNDYNAQLPVMSVASVNHPELAESFFALLKKQLPMARKNARDEFETEGAYFALGTAPHGKECSSGAYRFAQVAGPYWCYVMYRHYLMTKNEDFLKNTFIPILEGVAEFFCNWIVWNEQEQMYHLKMSLNPELMYLNLEDPVDTLAYLKVTMQAMVEFSQNEQLVSKCRHILEHYPDYALSEKGFLAFRGFPVDHMVHFRTVTPLYPTGEADPLFGGKLVKHARLELDNSSWDFLMKSYACKTGFQEGWTGRVYHRAIPACRLGDIPLATKILRNFIATNVKPNGLVSHNVAILANSSLSEANIANVPDLQTHHDHGPEPINLLEVASGRCWEECTDDLECKEKMFPVLEGPAVYLLLVSEMLMQCFNGILRLFPCWDKNKDASFTTLRAEGPILVSSQLKNKQVQYVKIQAEKPVSFKLLSPWNEKTEIFQDGKVRHPLAKLENISLQAGEKIVFSLSQNPKFAKDDAEEPPAPNTILFEDGTGATLGKDILSKYYAFLEKIREAR
jgi:hypothetical protein